MQTPRSEVAEDVVPALERAKTLHRKMVEGESRGYGDTYNAMRRLETNHGLPYWTQWNLWKDRLRGDGRSLLRRVKAALIDFLIARAAADLRALDDLLGEADGDADRTDAARLVAEAEALLADLADRREALADGTQHTVTARR